MTNAAPDGARARRSTPRRAPAASARRRTGFPWLALHPCRMIETNNGGSIEPVPGFDSRRALTDTFLSAHLPEGAYLGHGGWAVTPRAAAPREAPPRFGAHIEKVHGIDDRVRVEDPATIPWRCIAQLVVRYGDGTQGFGTGWLAGERTVITAAHVLVDPYSGVRAEEIQVIPGRNGAHAPYAFQTSHEWAVAKGWPSRQDASLDYGAIALPEPRRPANGTGQLSAVVPGGRELGWFGIGVAESARLARLLVNTAGYPVERDKPLGTLWFNAGRVQAVEDRFLTYLIDTTGGQSGAPVFFFDEETRERIVVAIHTTGYYPNRGIRITEGVFEQLTEWIANPPSGPHE